MSGQPFDIASLRSSASGLLRDGHPAEGLAIAVDGLTHFPDDADLLRIAGNCALVGGDDAAAVAWYARAIAADPRAVEPRINTGLIHRRHHRIDAARDMLRECLAIDPVNRAAWLNLASTYVNEGESEAGEAVAREAIRRCGELPDLLWNLALLLLERQAWCEGWRCHSARAALPGFFPRPWSENNRSRRLVDLGSLRAGDAVLCHGEQGLGDEILFAGMLREFAAAVRVRGADLLIACNPRLSTIFRRSFDFPVLDAAGELPSATWIVAIGDLGRFHRNEPDDFPRHRGYLAPDPVRVEHMRCALAERAAGRPLVGLAWTGGLPRTHAAFRRIPLATWLPLLRQPACFVSLQYRDDAAEVEALRRRHGIDILRMPQATMHRDYAETFALVAALDLVITVPTSVLHVAGAVGRDCWVIMDRRAAWRECSPDHTLPWYPLTHERFVSDADDRTWDRVMTRVSEAFRRRIAGFSATTPGQQPIP